MVNRSPADQVRLCGRNTKGVRLINLRDQDRVASLAVVARDESVAESDEVIAPTPPPAPTDVPPTA
ncbi:MAG: hypothetical protein EBS30_05245 [Planctomycetes bacterium]|jgi:DNA gyrase subunit A|nr:hypothetical protein [Planctomycetota bacterium]